MVGDRYLMTVKDVEWPDISPKVEAPNCLLPDGVVEMFAGAAQIVDRNEPRAILRGINLSFGEQFSNFSDFVKIGIVLQGILFQFGGGV